MAVTIDTERAMIHGANGSAMYSVVDGSIDIYEADELTDYELSAAYVLLADLIESEEEE